MSFIEATTGLLITEDEVRRLLLRDSITRRSKMPLWQKLHKPVTSLLVIGIVLYALLNAPAFLIKGRHYVKTDLLPQQTQNQGTAPSLPIPGATVQQIPKNEQPKYQNNHIYIPSINVDEPIAWNIEPTNSAVLSALQNGVAHFNGNAHPGQKGKVFIAGHSSDVLWHKGTHKQAFVLIPNLNIGDTIIVTYNDVPYEYRVSDKKRINPDDFSVLQNTDEAELNLMTCVPVGTNLFREIIVAKPTKPDMHQASFSQPGLITTDSKLPGSK